MIVCMNYKMLEYDRIDISGDIDMNKTSASKECDIATIGIFLDKNFFFLDKNFNDAAIVSIKKIIIGFIFGI